MQQKSAAWFRAFTAPLAEWEYGIDILDEDEITPLENPLTFDQNASDRLIITTGSVQLDVTANYHRSTQLTLRNTDGRYNVGAAGAPSGGDGSPIATGLVWYNTRLRPWAALRTSINSQGVKFFDKTYLGIFVVTNPEQQVKVAGGQMILNMLDKTALLSDPYLITQNNIPTFVKSGSTVGGYAAGTSFDSAMLDLISRSGNIPSSRISFEPSSLTLPLDYSITEGTDFWQHLSALAASMPQVLYFNNVGQLIRRSDPRSVNAPSVYTYTPGEQSTISEVDRSTDLTSGYNHVITLGGSSTTATYRGEAQITDPNNPYHKNFIGDRIVYVSRDKNGKLVLKSTTPDPAIGSTSQANDVAATYLAQFVGSNENLQITGRNNVALDPYDRFTVNVPESGLNMDFFVQKITWNLDNRGMVLESVKWFDIGS